MYKNYVHLQCEGCNRVEENDLSSMTTIDRPTAVSKVTNWLCYLEYPDAFFCSEECYEMYRVYLLAKDRDEAQSTFTPHQET